MISTRENVYSGISAYLSLFAVDVKVCIVYSSFSRAESSENKPVKAIQFD